ncbi:MAG TPA: SPFH domain-containing protein [Planctomycetota bacterium]|nr:SPFH domain-containing protein [Planctomycetota bacterium]HRV82073.1 SPFH domain-containing protein [Planctomycetota bacterium]
MFLFFFHCRGYFVVEPNMARVLILFGKYQGTVRSSGFWYTNPFANKRRISLRARNLDGSTLKVNDLLGNPVEISAVVVWQVEETAHATFDVDDYEHYVNVQSEAAVRNLAMTLPYDNLEEEGHSTTLRGSTDQVGQLLEEELRTRLASAGVHVIEARLKHLAYAPEIAHAMLQRQQAKAIIAARRQIVEGAVGMVEMALRQLSEDKIVELRDEDRAKLVGNLLVVLCSQSNAQPVLNTGNG